MLAPPVRPTGSRLTRMPLAVKTPRLRPALGLAISYSLRYTLRVHTRGWRRGQGTCQSGAHMHPANPKRSMSPRTCFQSGSTTWVLCLLVAGLMPQSCVDASADATTATADDTKRPLTTGVMTSALMGVVEKGEPATVSVGVYGVFYNFGRASNPLQWLCIGVHPSAEVAEAIFQASESRRSEIRRRPGATPDIGDVFRGSSFDAAPGTWRFRRGNVLVDAGWSGDEVSALALAREIDQFILTDANACPRGQTVPIPVVEVTVPGQVALGAVVDVEYVSTDGSLLRSTSEPVLHTAGQTTVRADALGTHTHTLLLATDRNVIFSRTFTIEVLPKEQIEAQRSTQPWSFRGSHLFYVESADQDWTATPNDDREWLQFDQSTRRPLGDLRELQQRALDDIARVIQEHWLPAVDLLQPAQEHTKPPRMVCYAAYMVRGCRIVYMGVLGRQVFLYIEQPDRLPEGQKRLTRADVLRDDLLQTLTDEHGATGYPRVQFVVRQMDRYRALTDYDEPFEPVHILLVDARLPDDVNLRSPGYR